MIASKYQRLVVQHPVAEGGFGPELIYTGETDYNSGFTLMFLRINEPTLMEEYPHSHDFDMYLYFHSFDANHMDDLGAEIEMGLGPEQERFLITTPTSVYIPKGLIHCPLHFKTVTKPILFVHASLAPKYTKKELH